MWPKNHRSQATRLRYQHSEITLHSAMCPGLKSPNINHTSRTVWKVLNLFSMAAASSSFATNEQTASRIWSLIGQRAQKDERRELWAAPMLMMCFTSPRKNDNQNTKLKYIHYLTYKINTVQYRLIRNLFSVSSLYIFYCYLNYFIFYS